MQRFKARDDGRCRDGAPLEPRDSLFLSERDHDPPGPCLSATIGSTRAARHAGATLAMPAIAAVIVRRHERREIRSADVAEQQRREQPCHGEHRCDADGGADAHDDQRPQGELRGFALALDAPSASRILNSGVRWAVSPRRT